MEGKKSRVEDAKLKSEKRIMKHQTMGGPKQTEVGRMENSLPQRQYLLATEKSIVRSIPGKAQTWGGKIAMVTDGQRCRETQNRVMVMSKCLKHLQRHLERDNGADEM